MFKWDDKKYAMSTPDVKNHACWTCGVMMWRKLEWVKDARAGMFVDPVISSVSIEPTGLIVCGACGSVVCKPDAILTEIKETDS